MHAANNLETFETDRLVARRPRAEDVDELYQLFRDERVMATLAADGKPLSREKTEQRLHAALAPWDEYGFGSWLFRERGPSGKFVGYCGIRKVVLEGLDEIELLYAAKSDRWGNGLATEMSLAVVSIAFDRLGLPSLAAFTLPANAASRRVIEKVGFRYEREIMHAGLPHALYRLRSEID